MKHYKFYKPRSSAFSSNSFREVFLATQEMLNILVVTVFSTALAENTLSKLLNYFSGYFNYIYQTRSEQSNFCILYFKHGRLS